MFDVYIEHAYIYTEHISSHSYARRCIMDEVKLRTTCDNENIVQICALSVCVRSCARRAENHLQNTPSQPSPKYTPSNFASTTNLSSLSSFGVVVVAAAAVHAALLEQ